MRGLMATGPARDEHRLATDISVWLAHRHPDRDELRVELRHAAAGWSNETLLVTAVWRDGREQLVVRLPPLVPSYPEHNLHAQADVQRVLRAAGYPAPGIVAVEDDVAWLGAPFLVMEHVDGTVAGQAPGLDPWITDAPLDAQRRVQDEFIEVLARLHTLPAAAANLRARVRHGVDAELEYWASYVRWAVDGAPPRALVDALEWCRVTTPAFEPRGALLWGDARLGNVMFDDDRRVVAVLDWELATIGPPEMDVAWFLALDELTSRATGARVPGFADHAAFVAAYEARLGRALSDLAWHEIFALVRSIAINDKQARLAAAAGVAYPGLSGDDNPVLRYVERRIARYQAPA
jgi:aminoglycoside phosphotransferase (APT) family kinase protein